ncbi:MAG: hypothetical protein HYV54_02785 [Parcubacteria group bacterium]|nr:hypothetical protein [Parcubacteria group bacterium]
MAELDISNNYAVRQFIGEFFENMTAKMFEAELIPARNFTKGEVHPDLSCNKLDAWLEVKATQESRYFKVYMNQVEKYRELLRPVPFPHSRLWYVFFTHTVFKISETYAQKTVEDLSRDLVRSIPRIVVLDFSIVDTLSRQLKILKKWTEVGFPPFLRWEHKINREFMEEPKNKLVRIGLKPSDYTIKKNTIELSHGRVKHTAPIVLVVKK